MPPRSSDSARLRLQLRSGEAPRVARGRHQSDRRHQEAARLTSAHDRRGGGLLLRREGRHRPHPHVHLPALPLLHNRRRRRDRLQALLNPDTVRGADAACIRRDRVPDPPPVGYASLAPDLAVEVVSASDRPGEVLGKVADWLTAGSRLVWVIDPVRRHARDYRADGSETLLGEHNALVGEDALPGFSCDLSEVG